MRCSNNTSRCARSSASGEVFPSWITFKTDEAPGALGTTMNSLGSISTPSSSSTAARLFTSNLTHAFLSALAYHGDVRDRESVARLSDEVVGDRHRLQDPVTTATLVGDCIDATLRTTVPGRTVWVIFILASHSTY